MSDTGPKLLLSSMPFHKVRNKRSVHRSPGRNFSVFQILNTLFAWLLMFKIYDLNGREVSRQKAAASRSSQEARISCIFFDRPKYTETHRPGSRVTSTWEQDLQRYLSTGGRHIIIPNRRTSGRRTKSADPSFQHRALVEMLSAGVVTNKESEQPLTPSITIHRATLPDVPDIEFKADLDDVDEDDNQDVISTPSDECSTKAISEENELPSSETSELERGKLLRLRMAEIFSKAVDNEGMGISTFAYLDDVEEEDQLNVIVSDSDGPLSSRSSTYTKNRIEKKENEVTDRLSLLRKILLSALLLKAALNIIRPTQSAMDDKSKNSRTFLDLQKQMEDEYKAGNFAFNKNAFKFSREKRLTKDAVRILTTPSAYRSAEMLQQARMAVITTTEEFSEFPLRMQGLIISHSWYESYSGRRMIIRQGQSAVNFYFIISGSVIVSVSRKNKLTGEAFEESVAILKAGQSFGELSLIYGGKRSATIVCNSPVELLVMSRTAFASIFMSATDETKVEHLVFLRAHPLIPATVVDKLLQTDEKTFLFTYFRRDTVICTDSNENEWIYFIKSGQCRILKDVRMLKSSSIKSSPFTYHERPLTREQFHCQRGSTLLTATQSRLERLPKKKEKEPERYFITLKELEANSVFGLETVAFASYGGTNSVALLSDGAECIAVNKKFFVKHCPTNFLNWLRRQVQPFPDDSVLESKLSTFRDWRLYKSQVLEQCISRL